MKKREPIEEKWETPSLEWLHHVRRELQAERRERELPLSRTEAEQLAKQFGLKLARPASKAVPS